MFFSSFFKVQKHRVFKYKPRFYKPEEDETLTEKLSRVRKKTEKTDAKLSYQERIKRAFKEQNANRNYSVKISVNRFIMMGVVIVLIFWYLLQLLKDKAGWNILDFLF